MFSYQDLLGYQQTAFINLILQIAILVMLAAAVWFKSKGIFRKHGALMTAAVILNLVSFITVMGPSFAGSVSSNFATQPPYSYPVTLIHIVFGSISLVSSIWLVGAWHLQSSTEGCVRRKQIMRITITLWTVALLLGIALYIILYPNILP